MLQITGERVLDGSTDLGPATVRIDDGQVVAIEPFSGTADFPVLAPGLVDLQVNGMDEVDVGTTDNSGFEHLDRMLRSAGTTSWCPTVTTRPLASYSALLDRLSRWCARDSVLGSHLEGPFLGGSPGAHDLASITAVDMEWLLALPDSVRLVTLAPEAVGATDATKLLTERGVCVALGHTSATTEETQAAVSAGARLVTHCFNGMRPLHHRDPGPVGVALADDRLTISLIGDLVHVHPVALQVALAAKPSDRVVLVSDSIGWASPTSKSAGMALVDGAPRLPDGTIAGTHITLLDAVRNLVSIGIDIAQVIPLATRNPAALLEATGRGVLQPGAVADVVALGHDLELHEVWASGQRLKLAPT